MYTRERKKGGNNYLSLQKKKKSTKKKNEDLYTIEQCVIRRDFSGGAALMEILVDDDNPPEHLDVEQWLGYCYFHLGEYGKAIGVYRKLLKTRREPVFHLYISCCYMFMNKYDKARDHALKGVDTPLRNRLLLQSNDKMSLEEEVMVYNEKVGEGLFDQLCLAAIHFRRGNYDDAIEIHKSILEQDNHNKALNYYLALDYFFKIGTEDEEEEKRGISYLHKCQHFMKQYLDSFPNSLTGINLLSCITHKMDSAEKAEDVLQRIVSQQNAAYAVDNMLVKHNLVVFSEGDNALKTLPGLVDIISEAKLNLVTYYLRSGEVDKGWGLVKDLEPGRAEDYVAKATVLLMLGQKRDSSSMISKANGILRIVGASETECNTLHGRLSWSQYLFLNKDYKEVVRYLSSIEDFMEGNEQFNWNYGVCLVKRENYKLALKHFSRIQNPMITRDVLYNCYLARCFIMTGNPEAAWQLYLKLVKHEYVNQMIPIIANDCYRTGHFWYALKAFDLLERMEMSGNPNSPHLETYWKAKRGSSMGVFQQIIAGREKPFRLGDLIILLQSGTSILQPPPSQGGGGNQQQQQQEMIHHRVNMARETEVEHMVRIMKNWAARNAVDINNV